MILRPPPRRLRKNIQGVFVMYPGTPQEIRLENTLTLDGALLFLRRLFRSEDVMPVSLYMGVTNADYSFESAPLSSFVAGEPVGNGYERQELPLDTATWDVSTVNNEALAQSSVVQFTASSAWDKAFTRFFLTDAETGDVGTVFAASKALATARLVLSGQAPPAAWQEWIRP